MPNKFNNKKIVHITSSNNQGITPTSNINVVPVAVPVLFCTDNGIFLRQLSKTNKISREAQHYSTSICDLRRRMITDVLNDR